MGYSGFFRCSTVRAALAPREHGHRLRFAAPGHRFAASAKRHAYRQCPLPGRHPHPSHADACCGAKGQKNPPRPRRSIRYPYPAWYWLHDQSRSWLSVLLRGRVRVFAAIAPLHAKLCRGCGGGAVKNVAVGAFFRACEGAATLRVKASSVGATRVQARPRHRSTEKPEQHVPEGHGRRPAINMVFYMINTAYGRRPANYKYYPVIALF